MLFIVIKLFLILDNVEHDLISLAKYEIVRLISLNISCTCSMKC